MKQYTMCFAIAAGILSVPCGFLFAVNVVNVRPLGVTLFASLLLLLWATYWMLRKQIWLAFPVSAGLAFLFWVLLAYQTAQRVIFVVENQGYERADGYGSPLAFLMGFVMEQLFFVPLSLLVVSALVAVLRGAVSSSGAT
jgi:hypothetical protein